MNIIYLPKIKEKIQQEIVEEKAFRMKAFKSALYEFEEHVMNVIGNKKADDIGTFEKGILKLLMIVGLRAVELFLAYRRKPPKNRRITDSNGKVYRYVKEKVYSLRSIFGEGRYVGSKFQRSKKELCPLESEVGLLPAGGLSPVLALEVVQLCTFMAYDKAYEVLRQFREYVPSKRSICGIIDLIGYHSEGVLDDIKCEGGEVAVIQVDGRGAPKISEEEYQKRCGKQKKRRTKRNIKGYRRRVRVNGKKVVKGRRTRGKKSKKKQVTVGIIYPLNRCNDGSWEGPYGKFFARFGDAEVVFKRLKKTLDEMGDKVKKVVFISDGAPQYRRLQLKYFPKAISVVDIYHVSEYLWSAGETVYKEGSEELANFVNQIKEMLLNGEVFEVLSILRTEKEKIALKGPGTKGRRKRISDTINYISKRVEQMPYKELREEGLEIGSGAIEGAVRQIVAIRLDGPGMRWGEHRPQLLLNIICIRLSGGWDTLTATIEKWARQLHYRRRITPIGVTEKLSKRQIDKDVLNDFSKHPTKTKSKIIKNAA